MYSTKPQALNIVQRKVKLQRRLIGDRSVEEGDRISSLKGYWQLLKEKGGFSGLLLLFFYFLLSVV